MRDPFDWPMAAFWVVSNLLLVPPAAAAYVAPPTPAFELMDIPDRCCCGLILEMEPPSAPYPAPPFALSGHPYSKLGDMALPEWDCEAEGGALLQLDGAGRVAQTLFLDATGDLACVQEELIGRKLGSGAAIVATSL